MTNIASPAGLLRLAACLLLTLALSAGSASATAPCGDFGECKVLVEINASDGDIGFHFLMDGDDLRRAGLFDPSLRRIFADTTYGPLREQGLTETFAESAEPLCWEDPEADPDEEIVTLEEFVERWAAGTYRVVGFNNDLEYGFGATVLTYDLPATPEDVEFDGSVISWQPGEDLGECADADRLADLVDAGLLPTHPEDVEVEAWEVVLVPDVEDGDPLGELVFSIRVPGDVSPLEVEVPAAYLAALPDDTPAKIEVGAIGVEDNATFSEEDGFCVNEVDGCDDEE